MLIVLWHIEISQNDSNGGGLRLMVSETVTNARVAEAVHAETQFGEEAEVLLAKLCTDEGDVEGRKPFLFLQFLIVSVFVGDVEEDAAVLDAETPTRVQPPRVALVPVPLHGWHEEVGVEAQVAARLVLAQPDEWAIVCQPAILQADGPRGIEVVIVAKSQCGGPPIVAQPAINITRLFVNLCRQVVIDTVSYIHLKA